MKPVTFTHTKKESPFDRSGTKKKKMMMMFALTLMTMSHSVTAFVVPLPMKPMPSPMTTKTSATTVFGMMDATYGLRKATFGIVNKETLRRVVEGQKKNDVVFLDVRNPDEIAESSLSNVPFVVVEGRYLLSEDSASIAKQASRDIPRKDTPCIVFCAKGGRAMKACQTLTNDLGYTNVYNAGGISDIDFL
jgi:rhodanese-related sulfurtransferase